MGRLDPYVEDRFAGTKVRDVDTVADESLLVGAEAVEGRHREKAVGMGKSNVADKPFNHASKALSTCRPAAARLAIVA